MSWDEFLRARAAYQAAIRAYVAHLPLWVNAWRGWETVLYLSSVLFVWRRIEARWLLATMIVSVYAYDLLGIFLGVSRFQSIALVAFWTPLAIYLLRRLRPGVLPAETRLDRIYAAWLRLVAVTLLVSVAFDVYNVAHYFAVDARRSTVILDASKPPDRVGGGEPQ